MMKKVSRAVLNPSYLIGLRLRSEPVHTRRKVHVST
jgi:hypothetical protein